MMSLIKQVNEYSGLFIKEIIIFNGLLGLRIFGES